MKSTEEAVMKRIYKVTMESDYAFHMRMDTALASAAIETDISGAWEATKYQTADAHHNPAEAAELIASDPVWDDGEVANVQID
jgi:hypothetical protein